MQYYVVPTVTDEANIRTWSEIGVIFLLFGLGLEFSFKKLVQVGGAAGICLAGYEFHRRIAYEDVPTAGAFMIFDGTRDLFEVARAFVHFFAHESCGFCSPCRVGTALLKGYMRGWVPTLAWLSRARAHTPRMWRYYWDSIEACAPPAQILATLQGCGFAGARLAKRLPVAWVRAIVIVTGVVMSVLFFMRSSGGG